MKAGTNPSQQVAEFAIDAAGELLWGLLDLLIDGLLGI